MKVQVITRTERGTPSDWAVVDDRTGAPDPEASRFLAHLRHIESSRNTVRAYAYGVAWYGTFLAEHDRGLDDASNELLGRFIHWLRSPERDVLALNDGTAGRRRSTVRLYLAAVGSFYRFLGAAGPGHVGYAGYRRLADTATDYTRPSVTVIDNVAKARAGKNQSRLGPRLKADVRIVHVLTIQQMHAILTACRSEQERLFFMLAATSGLRIGQILGLRHADINTKQRMVSVVPRDDNENLARAKSRVESNLPVPKETVRLYLRYMHDEYGFLESDYVFTNLNEDSGNYGHALTPAWAYGVVRRLKRTTGLSGWTPHTFRHTFVTLGLEAGVPMDVMSHLVTHASVQTTIDTYSHMSAEALRASLVRAGVWEES